MAKFLDKKEQVIDFQLTPYGNYLMSVGIFKPAYYAFYDSNILYDKQYVRGTYCKSASCGLREITEVEFNSDTKTDYSPMTTDEDGNLVPTEYLTIYDGTTPYNFWFKISDPDREPGTGVVGTKPMIDLTPAELTTKEDFAKAFWDQINSGPWPFTATYAGSDSAYVTCAAAGSSTDVSQTIDPVNVLAASVHRQGTDFEVFRAPSDVPVENQNEIEKRIKNETQYLEGILAFTDLEEEPRQRREHTPLTVNEEFIYDVTAIREYPHKDIFKFDSAIGDVRFDNENRQAMPAWKVVTLAGQINSSTVKDEKHDQLIPQINIDMMYSKEIKDVKFEFQDGTVQETIDTVAEIDRTRAFSDKKTIALEGDRLVIYTEELNSELLSENFDIEVYEVLPEKYDNLGNPIVDTERLKRKFFNRSTPQIVDGMMTRPSPRTVESPASYSTSSVEYYFDIYTDKGVSKKVACQGANMFNRDSYYIDIDFECEQEKTDDIYYDIYGRATDPEICQT